MTNEIFGGAVLTALLMCDSHVMSATKVATPFVMLSVSETSLMILIFVYFVKGDRGATCHSKHEVLAFLMIVSPLSP